MEIYTDPLCRNSQKGADESHTLIDCNHSSGLDVHIDKGDRIVTRNIASQFGTTRIFSSSPHCRNCLFGFPASLISKRSITMHCNILDVITFWSLPDDVIGSRLREFPEPDLDLNNPY